MQASPQATIPGTNDTSLNDAVEAVLAAALEADRGQPRRRSGALALTLLTGALALCFAVLVTADMAGSGDTAAPRQLPVSANLPAPDTSVPAARFSADMVADELPATF